jgi:hypothetical protein
MATPPATPNAATISVLRRSFVGARIAIIRSLPADRELNQGPSAPRAKRSAGFAQKSNALVEQLHTILE